MRLQRTRGPSRDVSRARLSSTLTTTDTETTTSAASESTDPQPLTSSTTTTPSAGHGLLQEENVEALDLTARKRTTLTQTGLMSSLLPCGLSMNLFKAEKSVASSRPPTPKGPMRPRASNPARYRRVYEAALVPRPKASSTSTQQQKNHRQQQRRQQQQKQRPSQAASLGKRRLTQTKQPPTKTWGDHLAESGVRVTYFPWIVIENVAPTTSLEAMTDAIEKVLDEELLRGIVDLDAPFRWHTAAPMLKLSEEDIAARSSSHQQGRHPYIEEARLILSPYARPTGWYVRLAHRSMAQALLVRSRKDDPLKICYQQVAMREYKAEEEFKGSLPVISDATIRVENCPKDLTKLAFLNFFSRFDLSMEHESIVQWSGVTPEGRAPSSLTYLVHFSDASWARAAIRERQGAFMSGHQVRLIQYPRQIIQDGMD